MSRNGDITMIIKVCGMREPENIRAVKALGVDMIGLVFSRRSPRYVASVPSCAGLLPDYACIDGDVMSEGSPVSRVGVFGSDMPQNIITAAYNYKLDYIQLHGKDDEIMIDNLRHTLRDDICPGIKFIKAIGISTSKDFELCHRYKGLADMFLFYGIDDVNRRSDVRFDWTLLDCYDMDIPFLLGGGIGPDDAVEMLSIKHPMMAGVNLNREFESDIAVKDTALLGKFISVVRNG